MAEGTANAISEHSLKPESLSNLENAEKLVSLQAVGPMLARLAGSVAFS